MATTHSARAGETLSKIANQYGFRNWRIIYDHPRNSAFRQRRPNPDLIHVGDEIFIPDKVQKHREVETGRTHVFQAPGMQQRLEFHLTAIDSIHPPDPIPNLTVRLALPQGVEQDFRTGANGGILITEPDIVQGTVDVKDIADATEVPRISYNSFLQIGLHTNQSNVLTVPDKRKVINRIAAAQHIIRRAAWGARTPNYSAMAEDWDYTTVVIHHSGDSGTKDPREIQRKHMDEKGYDDVGYHYMVHPTGRIYEGRYLTFKGSHVEHANTGKIGILIMGDFEHQAWDFDDDDLTPAQLTAAEALIRTLKAELGTVSKLGGHRDYKPTTECPGNALYPRLGALRTATGLGGP
jgi:hypothetical protein